CSSDLDPADPWGIRFWNGPLSEDELALSRDEHDRFYSMFTALIEALLARWGCVLLLDIHSYNHRRDGADAAAADPAGNPDIELGVTTLDQSRWGGTARRFAAALRHKPVAGRLPDVRENVRYPTGGECHDGVAGTRGDRGGASP